MEKEKISRAKFEEIMKDFMKETKSLTIYLAIHNRKDYPLYALRQVLERHFEIVEGDEKENAKPSFRIPPNEDESA